jgi:hypothetical protein
VITFPHFVAAASAWPKPRASPLARHLARKAEALPGLAVNARRRKQRKVIRNNRTRTGYSRR